MSLVVARCHTHSPLNLKNGDMLAERGQKYFRHSVLADKCDISLLRSHKGPGSEKATYLAMQECAREESDLTPLARRLLASDEFRLLDIEGYTLWWRGCCISARLTATSGSPTRLLCVIVEFTPRSAFTTSLRLSVPRSRQSNFFAPPSSPPIALVT